MKPVARPPAGRTRSGVAVNVAAVQFRHQGLLECVQRALDITGLPAHRLELEVTEALLLAGSDAVLATLHRLRALGVRIVMDDFGVGYSSLRCLRSFPFDKIKIDRSLVNEMAHGKESVGVVNALIGLARSFGMATTAEGVETTAQLDAVRSQGCTEVQGYLFSPPLPASGIASLLGALQGPREQAKTLTAHRQVAEILELMPRDRLA